MIPVMNSMKNPETYHQARQAPITTQFNRFRTGFIATVCAAAAVCFVLTGHAANILVNPGFEGSPTFNGWTAHTTESWSMEAAASQTAAPLVHSGVNSLWMQGLYGNGGAPNPYNSYAVQTIACAPGSTFTADAWFSQYVQTFNVEGGDNQSATNANGGSGLFASDANGQEDGWVEVAFLGSTSNILADYKSIILTPQYVASDPNTAFLLVTNPSAYHQGVFTNTYLAWIDCQVTNQYDPSLLVVNADPALHPEFITNTLSSGQYMTAPAGTVYVQYRVGICQNLYESGASYWDDCTLNLVGGPSAAVIGSLSPDGTKFFNIAATNFTFTVTSAAAGVAPLPTIPTNGIKILVNGADQSASLKFNGTPTNWNVALPNLVSNQIYNMSITVSNSAGLLASASDIFDSFGSNYFIVSSEDYDYNGGQFIQNPIPTSSANPNSYFGLAGVYAMDVSTYRLADGSFGGLPGGSSQLVRSDGFVAFQEASDLQLPIYLAQNDPNVYNVNLSYNNPGNWENYTRNYPTGNYKVYARISGGAGLGLEYLNLLTGGYGTYNQTTNNIGVFILANGTDWGHYYWVPLTDSYGNVTPVNVPAGQQTLQLLSGGGENVIDFMFVPFSSTGVPPVINNFNPAIGGGANIFVNTNKISFSVSSLTSTIATNKVQTLLNGIDISSSSTFTGNNTNWNASVSVPPNQILTLVVNATDNNGLSNSVTSTFDTFSQNNFMIEAEDFDFNGGQFIDNPIATGGVGAAPNSYYLYPQGNINNVSVVGVDLTTSNNVAGETFIYRPLDSCGTEVTTDFLRTKFATNSASDYDVGWWTTGAWLNYTRTFPTNNYNVYGRLAGGGPFSGTTLSLVTGGWDTSSQTTQLEGSFADPAASGWQVWHWVPLLNGSGQLVTISLGGTNTIKVTSGSGLNANFYMFVPAIQAVNLTASISGNSISLKFPTPQTNATYTVLYSSSLTGGSWQALGASITGDGTTKTVTDTLGSQRFYKLLIQ
jgi:hypothetical protein